MFVKSFRNAEENVVPIQHWFLCVNTWEQWEIFLQKRRRKLWWMNTKREKVLAEYFLFNSLFLFIIPNFFSLFRNSFHYSLSVKKTFLFRARKGKRRNVVLFALKRGNKRHLQKLCVQCRCSYNTRCAQSSIMKSLIIPLYVFPQSYFKFLLLWTQ